ncbi:MAG TPA: hypothetical protein VL048_03680 [Xanthobacteraceae bacterium]|nr:hypothetical protein [Xanthobacteraceae bacterium]
MAAEISSHREAAATHGDRVTLLQSKADAERQAQQLADYEAAVDRMEANLLPRSAAATKLEEAFKALAVAARNFREANETARKCRPANLPYLDDYHLSLNRLAERARACFEPAAAGKGILVRRYSGQPAGTSEFLAMLFDADCRVDGFASKEVEHHKLLVAEIREKGPVERKPDQEAAA